MESYASGAYAQVVDTVHPPSLGGSVESLGEAAMRLENIQRDLENRLIGSRPELANAVAIGGPANVSRPLAIDVRGYADRLHRACDALEKLRAQL